MSCTPLSLGTQGRADFGSDFPLALGTQGRFIIDGVVPPTPFDPIVGGGQSLPGERGNEHVEHIRRDDDRVLMAVIKKFMEMQNDG